MWNKLYFNITEDDISDLILCVFLKSLIILVFCPLLHQVGTFHLNVYMWQNYILQKWFKYSKLKCLRRHDKNKISDGTLSLISCYLCWYALH